MNRAESHAIKFCLIAAAVACLLNSCQGEVKPKSVYASLKFVNLSSDSIAFCYISRTNEMNWGDDCLGSKTVKPGESKLLNGIAPGMYNIKVETLDRAKYSEYPGGAEFHAGETLIWNVTKLIKY
ncbi:MAG: hypothetical protein A2Y33_10295 [Spirochaetes bacterium GWF1_51_8]|nr:MAG: hypothetical protein A2Y33_10295 [Spirochaetes bacterium GWF1_51_8]